MVSGHGIQTKLGTGDTIDHRTGIAITQLLFLL